MTLLAVYFQLASSNYSCRVIFQTGPRKFSKRLLNFCSRFSDRWSRPSVVGWVMGALFSPSYFACKCFPAPSHRCSVHFKWSLICVFQIPPKRDFFASLENFFLWLIKVSKSILFISFKFKKWKAVLCMITVIWIHTRRCFIFTQCLV